MEGVDTDPQVEGVLAGGLGDILVCADTGSLESLARQLLILVGNKVDTVRELVDISTLAAQVEDADLLDCYKVSRRACNFVG